MSWSQMLPFPLSDIIVVDQSQVYRRAVGTQYIARRCLSSLWLLSRSHSNTDA